MIRIAVVDDDKTIFNQIHQYISEAFGEEIKVEKYESSTAFFTDSDNLKYNMIFLDIDMPEINGFELAEMLKNVKPDITIVFVSHLEHLVFQSFQFRPFGFVRKSCLKEDITFVITDYRKELIKNRDVYILKTQDSERSVPLSNIMYFESMKHAIYVQTVEEKYKIKREREYELSMKTLSEQFEPKGFIRVHKSFLVNYRHIYIIRRDCVVLKNHMSININPHKFNEIKSAYQRFLMEG